MVQKNIRTPKGTSTALYDALRVNDHAAFVKEVQWKLRKNPQWEKAIRDGYQYLMANWEGIHEALTQTGEWMRLIENGGYQHIM